MSDQHPEQLPGQSEPPRPPQPTPGSPATQSMPVGAQQSPANPGPVPQKNVWHQVTSTHGGRWAIGIAAVVLVALMFLSVGVAGFLVLRNHDRFALMGQRLGGYSRSQPGRGPGANNGYPQSPGMPGAPGMRAGPGGGPSGLGGVLGGTALHGNVTARVNGVTQPLVFQRGQVSAVSATSITLTSSDGFVGTYGRTNATRSGSATPATGGQAFVLARASDKVAITIRAM
jgi:hypothetical protein